MAPKTRFCYQLLQLIVICTSLPSIVTPLIVPLINHPTHILHLGPSGLRSLKPSDRIDNLLDSEWIAREPSLTKKTAYSFDETTEGDSMETTWLNLEESLAEIYGCSTRVLLPNQQSFHATHVRPLRRRDLRKRGCKDQSIWKRIHRQLKRLKRRIVMWIIETLADSKVVGMRTYVRFIKFRRLFGGKW